MSWWTNTQNEFPHLCPEWPRKCSLETLRACSLPIDCVKLRLCETKTEERCFYNSSKFELFPWSSFIMHFVSWLNSIPPTPIQNPNKWLVPSFNDYDVSREIASGRSVSCGEMIAKSMSMHSDLSICKAEEPCYIMKAFKQAKVCQNGYWQLIFVGYRPRQSLREQNRKLPLVQSLVTIW